LFLAPKGYSVVIDGWGIETREDTYTCHHCCSIVFVPARSDPDKHKCKRCYRRVCERCYGHDCDPYEAKLDRAEATDAWLRQRLSEKLERTLSDKAAIELALRRRSLLKDMGLGI
jgi:hypothetical protein